jgi:hypothetical protein
MEKCGKESTRLESTVFTVASASLEEEVMNELAIPDPKEDERLFAVSKNTIEDSETNDSKNNEKVS